MNRGTVSEDNSFGPDGYQGAPPDIAEALDSGVFVEDTFPSPEDLRREVKRTVSIRLDPDVYAWFKLPGPGYQTRINAVLRAYMTAQISKKGSAIVGAAAKLATRNEKNLKADRKATRKVIIRSKDNRKKVAARRSIRRSTPRK
jgi:hypothetical protein